MGKLSHSTHIKYILLASCSQWEIHSLSANMLNYRSYFSCAPLVMIPWFVVFLLRQIQLHSVQLTEHIMKLINVCNICQFYCYLTKTSFKIINMIYSIHIYYFSIYSKPSKAFLKFIQKK